MSASPPKSTAVLLFPFQDPAASVDLIDLSTATFTSVHSPGIRKKFAVDTDGETDILTGSLNYSSPAELSGSQVAVVNTVIINGESRLSIVFTGASGNTAQFVSNEPYEVVKAKDVPGTWSST